MCFSEEASFVASAVLAAVGIASLRKAKKHPERYLIAAIPLLFAIQQAAEGVQWLHFKGIWDNSKVADGAKQLYLLIALVLWPFWMPFSAIIAEKERGRKFWLFLLTALGALVSVYTASRLLAENAIAEVVGSSIQYTAHLNMWVVIPYIIAGIAPWFVSSISRAKYLGWGYLLSCGLAGWFYLYYFTSIWCFACAVVSILVYATVTSEER